MNTDELAFHYAQALLKLSLSNEQLEQHLSELQEFVSLLNAAPPLKQALNAPSISNKEKKKVLQSLLQGKLDHQLLSFLSLLIDKNRFKYLPKIEKEYQQLAKKALGILTVKLITAVAVEESLKEKVQTKLEQVYQKKVEIIESIDPQIIGGMVLMIDHQIMDLSIKNRLNKLKENLLEANI